MEDMPPVAAWRSTPERHGCSLSQPHRHAHLCRLEAHPRVLGSRAQPRVLQVQVPRRRAPGHQSVGRAAVQGMGSKTRRGLSHANDHDIIRRMTSIVTRKIISLPRTMSVMIHRAMIVMNGDEFDNVLQVKLSSLLNLAYAKCLDRCVFTIYVFCIRNLVHRLLWSM